MSNSFTPAAARVMQLAAKLASELGHIAVRPEHVLLAISQSHAYATNLLHKHEITPDRLRIAIARRQGFVGVPSGGLPYSKELNHATGESLGIMIKLFGEDDRVNQVGISMLMLAILSLIPDSPDSLASEVLSDLGVDLEPLTAECEQLVRDHPHLTP